MSENFRGITFAEQGVKPADDAIVRRAILPDGILTGCKISYSGSTLTMAAGYIIACGRTFQHIAAQNWAVVDATSGFARLVLTIDLTKTATKDTFSQIDSAIEYATSEDGFVGLDQQDINLSGIRYQIAACVVSLGTGGITGIVSQLPVSRAEGGGLNFRVVGGETQPNDRKENDIWVITPVKIPAYYFQPDQPVEMQPGEVWIFTGTSSAVAFNALKKGTLMVYPIRAMQMVDGSLIDVSAKSWQGGAWVDWIPAGVLYKEGVYGVLFDKWIFAQGIGIIAEETDHVLLSRTSETDSQIGWWTAEKQDLSKYSKLYAEVICSNFGVLTGPADWRFHFGAFSGRLSGIEYATTNMVAGTPFTANKAKTTYEVDISEVRTACYVGVQGTGIAEVYKIWME